MANSEELIRTIEHVTLYARCRFNRCRYKRVRLYLYHLRQNGLYAVSTLFRTLQN
jgi:hypothetical protein